MIRDTQLSPYNPAVSTPLKPQFYGTVWMVVFDRRGAKIFEKDGLDFNILHELANERIVDDGISNDTIGRGVSFGAGRHGYEPSMEESRQNEFRFSKDLAMWLQKAHSEGLYDSLVLVAGPQMLGNLRKDLTKQLQDCVIGESSKDLMHKTTAALERSLIKIMPGPEKE